MINNRNCYLEMAIQPMQFALHMTQNAKQYATCATDATNIQLIIDRLKEAIEITKEESVSAEVGKL